MTGIVVYGADWCGDCRRAKAVFEKTGTPYKYIDLVEYPEETQKAREISGRTNIPVIVFPDSSILVEPSDDEILAKLK